MRCQAKIRTESGGGVALAPHRGGGSDATNNPEQCCKQVENVCRCTQMDLALYLCVKECKCEANDT
jgi:hypothetical protein